MPIFAADDPGVIQQLVAPAVMVPACGLLLLSSTARMNTVLARVRAFHAERLNIWRDGAEAGTRAEQVRDLRLEGLERQTHRLLDRASLLRITMLLLFSAIACNLFTMLALALRHAVGSEDALYVAAIGIFLLGVVLVLASMVSSALEVGRILETVRYEHGRVEGLCGGSPPDSMGDTEDLSPIGGEGLGL